MAEETKTEITGTNVKAESAPSVEELTAKIKELEGQLSKSKHAYNNASSDSAEWKRKFRETQDEATRKEAERDEELSALKEKVASYEKKTLTATYKATYLAMGYSEELATRKAAHIANGEIEQAMGVEKEFINYYGKQIKAASVRSTPAPQSGVTASATITAEAFRNMGISERAKLLKENPELYSEFTKK